MIIHTRTAEVIVYALRRLPEIDAPNALSRMVDAMMAQSQNYHGLARQVVAHAGNRAGVESTWKRGTGELEVSFFVPPGLVEIGNPPRPDTWIAKLTVNVKIDEAGAESFFFTLRVRHNNPIRDVRILAAALIAEDERKCTTTVSPDEGAAVHNLAYALQVALAKI